MLYDTCPRCRHDWHGLTCGKQTIGVDSNGHYTVFCECPSQFVLEDKENQ